MPLLRSASNIQDGDYVVTLQIQISFAMLSLGEWCRGYHKNRSTLYLSVRPYHVRFGHSSIGHMVHINHVFAVLNGKPPVDPYDAKKLLRRIAYSYREHIYSQIVDSWYDYHICEKRQ